MEVAQGRVAEKEVAFNSRTLRTGLNTSQTRLLEGIGEEGVEEATPRDID